MRYRLRTLLIVLAVLPPVLAVGWWKNSAWKAEQERERLLHEIPDGGTVYSGAPLLTPPALPPDPPNFEPDPTQPKAPAKAGE